MTSFVVTLPASEAADPTRFFRRAQRAGADLLEVRGDLTPNPATIDRSVPVLLAPRGRSCAWARRREVELLDLEDGEAPSGLCGRRVVRSFHDHRGTPPFGELVDRAAALRRQGADVIKIATTVTGWLDLLTLHNLQDELREHGPATVLGMGPLAALNRWLSPWRNAHTYAFLNGHAVSAEGQVALEDYRRLHGAEPPRLFGVLGAPGFRSFSPRIHNRLFELHGLRARYFALPTDDLEETWKVLERLGVEGLSVTSPWKKAVVRKMLRLDPLARELGAVNTCVREGGVWVGHQRDVEGFVAGYPELRELGPAVVYGSGGVVPAVVAGLRRLGIDDVLVLARDEAERKRVAERHGAREGDFAAAGAAAAAITVWTLPVDRADILLPRRSGRGIAVDLRYGGRTDFLRRAEEAGWRVRDGLAMLVRQALEQFELFTRVRPDEGEFLNLLEMLRRDGE